MLQTLAHGFLCIARTENVGFSWTVAPGSDEEMVLATGTASSLRECLQRAEIAAERLAALANSKKPA